MACTINHLQNIRNHFRPWLRVDELAMALLIFTPARALSELIGLARKSVLQRAKLAHHWFTVAWE